MANIRLDLDPEQAQYLGSTYPQFDKFNGTNFPVSGLRYDASLDEAAFWKIDSFGYGASNPTITCDVLWQADNATSGSVRWEAAIAAVMTATVTISNLDSVAASDIVWVRIKRIGSNAADTLANDAWLLQARLTYSDT